MKTEKKIAIAACIALLIILLVNTPFTCSQTKLDNATYMVFSKDIAFKLPAYNTIIYFAENYKFTKFEWDQWNATMIYFYNLQMDGDEVPKFGVSVRNANLTIVDLFVDQRLHVTLDAPSRTISTLTVYCGDYGEPEYIYVEPDSELVSWSYNVSTSLLTVQVKHGSPANITISWVSTSSGGVVPSKIRTQIVLDTATLSVKPNETVVVSGRLLDEFYNPIPNGKLTVTFLWNGSKITVYSDVDGRFTFTFKAPSEKGRYAVHIYFTGDTTHSSAEKIYRFYVGPPIGLPVPLNLPSLPPTQTLILTAVFAAYIYLKKRRGKNA